ncbi:cyclic peptide export ABC transporter [Desmonostoc muscorum LEGE 12446]|uniref:Cyclic peptide export ABC transporter n=1 Tax=Desmonostoc muscorum LEGE 12446 TaxID=1828758 RepID=A0A8J7DIE8_DESMC|nr:cyclic peptide export ABC transporter [Desmonostoc muscorum]MCF2150815.1 cyclic peptide export ABC transporter [Desmonostoc muscorum LEGE 12446]
MKLIRLLLKTSWKNLTLAMLTGLISGVSNAGLIALINISLTNPEVPKSVLASSFVGLCLLILLTNAPSQILLSMLAQHVIFDLRMQLTRRILAAPLRQLEELGSPTLLASLTEDVEVISKASLSLSILCLNIAMLLGCMLYLSWLSVKVFLLLVVYIFLGFSFFGFLMGKGRRLFELARKQQDRLLAHFQTTTEGIKELKLHHQRRQAFVREDVEATAAASRRYQVAAMTMFGIVGGSAILVLFIPIGLLLFVLPLVSDISMSIVSGFVLTIVFMLMPLQMISAMLPELMRANVAVNKIESLGLSLAAQTTELDISLSSYFKLQQQKLELIEVTHAYQREGEVSQFILGPINLIFSPGELVFIVGGNGSGKSTLVKLIAGLYIPESGTIRLGRETITEANREWYRQHFSVVFSDFYLFDRLLGFERDRIDKQTQHYLKQLQLDKKVQVKDGHFSSTALSQGQRKRLALLTAYLEDRPIYVFDEWASDQDPMFKQIFYTQLVSELKQRGKTVLVISHDDHYFYLADRIIKLDSGKVEYDQHPLSLAL